MIILAGAFGTFVGFVFLGLLALPVTAMLNKSLGKEKALLLWSVIILLITVFGCQPEKPGKAVPKPKSENKVPAEELTKQGNPFDRAGWVGSDVTTRLTPIEGATTIT